MALDLTQAKWTQHMQDDKTNFCFELYLLLIECSTANEDKTLWLTSLALPGIHSIKMEIAKNQMSLSAQYLVHDPRTYSLQPNLT